MKKLDFMKEQVSEATTLLKFRHLLEENHLGEVVFKAINRVMEATVHIMHGGMIVHAIVISALSSLYNRRITKSLLSQFLRYNMIQLNK